jgi:hypothetical protein
VPAAHTLVGNAHFMLFASSMMDWPTASLLCSSHGGALAYFDNPVQ